MTELLDSIPPPPLLNHSLKASRVGFRLPTKGAKLSYRSRFLLAQGPPPPQPQPKVGILEEPTPAPAPVQSGDFGGFPVAVGCAYIAYMEQNGHNTVIELRQ